MDNYNKDLMELHKVVSALDEQIMILKNIVEHIRQEDEQCETIIYG